MAPGVVEHPVEPVEAARQRRIVRPRLQQPGQRPGRMGRRVDLNFIVQRRAVRAVGVDDEVLPLRDVRQREIEDSRRRFRTPLVGQHPGGFGGVARIVADAVTFDAVLLAEAGLAEAVFAGAVEQALHGAAPERAEETVGGFQCGERGWMVPVHVQFFRIAVVQRELDQ